MARQRGVSEGMPQRLGHGGQLKDVAPRGSLMGLLADLALEVQMTGEFDDADGGAAWTKALYRQLEDVAPESGGNGVTQDALTAARGLKWNAIRALTALSQTDGRVLGEMLDAVEDIEPADRRVPILSALAPHLPPALLLRAHATAIDLPAPSPNGKSAETRTL
jgi:hypothetical protein